MPDEPIEEDQALAAKATVATAKTKALKKGLARKKKNFIAARRTC